jgi:excisionase family DNA binding protein
MDKKAEPAVLTADEAHEFLGRDKISRASLYAALQRREIPNIRLGRRILVPRGALEQWLQNCAAAQQAVSGDDPQR